MLSFLGLKPSCPVNLEERVWIERRMAWLCERLGRDRLKSSAVILAEEIGIRSTGQITEADAQTLFTRVVGRMSVPQQVELQIVQSAEIEHSLASYQNNGDSALILVRADTLGSVEAFVAAIAHELAHSVLISGGHLTEVVPDLEPLCDLTAAFCGFGIFVANTPLQESRQNAGASYADQFSGNRYLNAMQAGYALAVVSWLIDEPSTEWASQLCLDARETFQRGVKFLRRSDSYLIFERTPSQTEVAGLYEERLKRGSDAVVYSTLVDMSEHEGELPDYLLDDVIRNIRHRNDSIAAAALTVLVSQEQWRAEHETEIIDSLSHDHTRVQYWALWGLRGRPLSEFAVESILELLRRQPDKVVRRLAYSVLMDRADDLDGDKLVPDLLKEIRGALLDQNEVAIIELLKVLDRMAPDADEILRERFEYSDDDEWWILIEDCLKEARSLKANEEILKENEI